jgi:hypothetical protein
MEDSEFLWTADLGDESFLTTSMDNSGYAPVMNNEYEDQSNNIGQQMYIQNGGYQLSTGYNVNTAQTQGMMSNLPIGYTNDYNQHTYVQTQGMGVPVNNIQSVELPILPIPGYPEAEPIMMDAPPERPLDLYPEDADAVLVHLSAIKDTFDKLLRDIEPEKRKNFSSFPTLSISLILIVFPCLFFISSHFS